MHRSPLSRALTFLVLPAAALLAPTARAADAPRFAVTAGYAHINQDADGLVPVARNPAWPAGSDIESSDDAGSATFGASWHVTPEVAIELWGAAGTRNDIEVDIENGPDLHVARYRTRPLALSVQYHFRDVLPGVGQRFTPFVGLGYHRTTVSGARGGALAGYEDLRIDDGSGLAASAGVDFALGQRWFMRGDVRYLRWDASASTRNGPLGQADMDSLAWGASVGLRF